MSRSVGVLLVLAIVILEVAAAASFRRLKRGEDWSNDDLRAYARPHSGTRIIHGTAQRYAPNEWPKWYVWTLMNWGGHSRLTPSNRIGQGGQSGGGGGGSSFGVNSAGGGGGGANAYGRRR